MKKTSSRSQRGSKGIKGKHILQICVLLGVCIWLIYQVKYSHDKKKEFFEKDAKKSTVSLPESEIGLVKLGRKDLLPGYNNQKEKNVEDEDDEEISHGEEEKEKKSKVENGNHEEEEEEEEEVVEDDEEDKNKQGEEVAEEDEEENKKEEDEIDEQDQSKTDKDDELLDEEKEKETNHEDEIDMTVDEAHEENYKADDASSAVSHESRVLNTEKLKESSGNSTETVQEIDPNVGISEVKIQKEPGLKLGEAESSDFVNKTATGVKDGDTESSKMAVTESRNETVNGNVTEAIPEAKEILKNETEAILEATEILKNETEIMRERSEEHDKTEDGAPPSGTDLQTVFKFEQTRNESDPKITVSANITNKDSIQEESKNSTSESSLIENISGSNTTEVKENSTSEKESSNLFATEQTEETDDTSETKILQEEREALTDPQTLPDIRTQGNEEDEEEAMAAE